MSSTLDFPGNRVVMARLQRVVTSRNAIAFVGAGASAGLYPLWSELIDQLMHDAIDLGYATNDHLSDWLTIAATQPQEVVSEIKNLMPYGTYIECLRRLFAPRNPVGNSSFTPIHGALLRAPFRGYVTTNYDPGLLEARHRFRKSARATGVATWRDRDALNAWLTDKIFDEDDAPILFAHGIYNRSDTIVLSADDYSRAYRESEYPYVIKKLWSKDCLVFVGFGFSDYWLDRLAGDAIVESLSEVEAPRHIALLGLPEGNPYTPEKRKRAQRRYNSDILFYPVSKTEDGWDHSALLEVIETLADSVTVSFDGAEEEDSQPKRPVSTAIRASLRQHETIALENSTVSNPSELSVLTDLPAGRLRRILERRRLRCGCVKHPPLCDFEWHGELPQCSGLYVDMSRVVENHTGISIELLPLDWSELRDAFRPPLDLDLVLSVFESRERLNFADFTAFFYTIGVGAIVKRGDERFKTASDLRRDNICIIVTKGEIGWEYVTLELRLPRRRLIIMETSDLAKMAASVVRGDADIAICDEVTCATMERLNPEVHRIFRGRSLYLCKNAIMVPKNEPSLSRWVLAEFERARSVKKISESEESILAHPEALVGRFT